MIRDPSVWSRAPKNICDVLEAKGRLGQAFWGLPHAGTMMKLRAAMAAVSYCRPRQVKTFLHTRSQRSAHADHMMRERDRSGLSHFLHFAGDRYLSLTASPRPMKQYLLIDSTWDYWRDPQVPEAYFKSVNAELGVGCRQMDHIFTISKAAQDMK